MKKLLSLFAILALCATAQAQVTSPNLDAAVKDAQAGSKSLTGAPPVSIVAAGLIDPTGDLVFRGNSSGGLVFEGATKNAFETTVTVTDPTADRTITLPNASGTVTLNAISAYAATATAPSSDLYGSTLTNTGAAGAVVVTLPAPVVGMEFTVFLTVAQDVDINPANGTSILVLTNAAGDAISSAATIGNRITLRAISTTEWIPLETSGTWSDAN
jgi:hypothetical protein